MLGGGIGFIDVAGALIVVFAFLGQAIASKSRAPLSLGGRVGSGSLAGYDRHSWPLWA